ncbi:pyridoxal phosphate-dependent transferase [Pisolithus tinctorius]|nr:pyridoxal phosphate-dependent transferase [Pisolithus tinctorius]
MEDFDYSCNVQVGASALVESGEPPPTKSSPAKHRPSLPRWWSHPTYRDLRRPNYHPLLIVFDPANGAKIWDPEGKEYIDMLYANSAIVAAPLEQARKLCLSSRAFYNSIFGSVFPVNITAVKLSGESGRAMALGAEGSFHGGIIGVIRSILVAFTSPALGADRRFSTGYLDGVGPTFHNISSARTGRYGVAEGLERALELYGETALLMEPIQGVTRIFVPLPGCLAGIRKLCTKHNVSLMCVEFRAVRSLLLLLLGSCEVVYPVSAVLAERETMYCIGPGEHGMAMTTLRALVGENFGEGTGRLGEFFKSPLGGIAWQFCLLLKSRGVLAKPTRMNIMGLQKAAKLDDIPGEVES